MFSYLASYLVSQKHVPGGGVFITPATLLEADLGTLSAPHSLYWSEGSL